MSGFISLLKGRKAEAIARNHLEKLGFHILSLNYKSRFGELDIIAREGEDLVFIEVKSRGAKALVSALEAVDRQKQAKIIRTAMYYIAEFQLEDSYIRFDVLKVDGNGNCSLFRDAFWPEG